MATDSFVSHPMAGEADAIAISGGGDGWGGGWGGGGFWPLWFINQQICDGDKEILASVAHSHSDTLKAIADADGRVNLHLANLQAGLLKELCDVKTTTLLAAKDAALENCRLKGELSAQIAASNSQLSRELSECCCKIERQLEACCCKLEREVDQSARATQALIANNENQKLRDALAAEQQKNLVFQLQCCGPCPAPVRGGGRDCRHD